MSTSRQHPKSEFGPEDDAHAMDVQLAAAIIAGEEEAWHAFVEKYAGLILHVLKRYLFDPDQRRTTMVDVLEKLYCGKLAQYRGRSSLASWLILVTRNAATDALRREFGRRETPRGLRGLDQRYLQVFQFFYVEGRTFVATQRCLADSGYPLDDDALLVILARIDATVSQKTMRRISYDLAAESLGAASGRMLDYCEHARAEEEAQARNPLDDLLLAEAERRARLALRLIDGLPDRERRIVALRFSAGLSAKEIATKMGIAKRREVYTILDRIMRRLRREAANDDADDAPRKSLSTTL